VLAFGNSLTYGTGALPEESYPAVLERLIGREVINAGVPGELSSQGLRRLPGTLEHWQPALVLLCHGGNDLLRRSDGAETEQNLREMVRIAAVAGTPVVLLGVPRAGLVLRSAALYRDVADDLQVPLEAEILPTVLGDNRLKSDPIHPNAVGYRRIAEAVRGLLGEAGAL
jgi:lysophospholipase L1-like esterase